MTFSDFTKFMNPPGEHLLLKLGLLLGELCVVWALGLQLLDGLGHKTGSQEHASAISAGQHHVRWRGEPRSPTDTSDAHF